MGLAIGVTAGLAIVLKPGSPNTSPDRIETFIACIRPTVVDGDTIRCSGERIRLANIDAPEMPGHCRPGRRCTPGDPYAARDYLVGLTRGKVECQGIERDSYGRMVARCRAEDADLSCAMVAGQHAVERYGSLSC